MVLEVVEEGRWCSRGRGGVKDEEEEEEEEEGISYRA